MSNYRQTPIWIWIVACMYGLATRTHGQGTLVFNNLGKNDALVFLDAGARGQRFLLNQDLNFNLLAGQPGGPLHLVHQWLLKDGSAKGINVAPGRFADPSHSVFVLPDIGAGQGVDAAIQAWPGHYESYSAAQFAEVGGFSEFFTSRAGSSNSPPPSLLGMPPLNIGIPGSLCPLTLGIDRSNGLPRLRITGWVGNSYALEYLATFSAANPWAYLLGRTNWILTQNPQYFIDTSDTGTGQRFYRARLVSGPPPSLVWINPGTFLLGSPVNEADRESNEGPQTQVTFTHGFWLGKYEVTQLEYQSVVEFNPSQLIGEMNRPVEMVSWMDATNYCALLTERERQMGRLPAGYAYRLPTEAEWEYAARAGSTNRFSYGNDPGYTSLANYAWYAANSGDQTHPVGQKQPNAWGLYDVYGNVTEWSWDCLVNYPGGTVTNLVGSVAVDFHVVRGGSDSDPGPLCRSAARAALLPERRIRQIGFRVVLAPNLP